MTIEIVAEIEPDAGCRERNYWESDEGVALGEQVDAALLGKPGKSAPDDDPEFQAFAEQMDDRLGLEWR